MITGTVLSGLSLLVTVGAIIAGVATVWWGDKLVVRREIKKVQGDGDQQKVEALRQNEEQLTIDLRRRRFTTVRASSSCSAMTSTFRSRRCSRFLGNDAKGFDENGLSAQTDVERLSGELQNLKVEIVKAGGRLSK